MDISLLKEFIVLAQSETFLKAADVLFISQPTLSRHIKNLEAELGAPLFERTTRSSKLTKYGQMLLPYARQIVELHETFNDELAEEKRQQGLSLRISSIAAMDVYGIDTMITRFKETCSHVKTHIVPRHNGSFTELLLSRTCDFAFVREPRGMQDDVFARLTLTSDHFVAVVPGSHALAGGESTHLSKLKGEECITLPEGTTVYQIFEDACEKQGFLPDVVLTHHNVEHIINCVRLGMGIAILTDRLIDEKSLGDEVKVVDLYPAIYTDINLCYLKQASLTDAGASFVRMAQEEFRSQKHDESRR